MNEHEFNERMKKLEEMSAQWDQLMIQFRAMHDAFDKAPSKSDKNITHTK